MRELARELDARACGDAVEAYASGSDRTSPKSFFGRVLLQARIAREPRRFVADESCPSCGHLPQVGLWVPEGDGTTLMLSCAICFGEWRHSREHCPACREQGKLVHFQAPEIEHLEVRACDGCRTYLNVVRVERAPDAVPDVDEIAALPLDVWAHEHGYRKLVKNLVGM